LLFHPPPHSTLFPYTTLFRSHEHKNMVYWNWISANQKLSEEFIHEHKNLVNWEHVSQYQKLSESFIREHKNLVDWWSISIYQNLDRKSTRLNSSHVKISYAVF